MLQNIERLVTRNSKEKIVLIKDYVKEDNGHRLITIKTHMENLKIKIDYKLGFKAIDYLRKDLLRFVIIF